MTNRISPQTRRQAQTVLTSFVMTPTGLLVVLSAIIVSLVLMGLFAGFALPILLELILNPLVWAIGIILGIIGVESKNGNVPIFMGGIAGLLNWGIVASVQNQAIQQSFWSQIPFLGSLYQASASIPIYTSLPIYVMAFVLTSYSATFILGALSKGR